MKRKTYLFFVSVVLGVTLGASAAPFEYLVSGNLNSSEYEGKKAYMMLYDSKQLIDSAVVSNGKFIMKSNSDISGMARVDIDMDYTNLILNPGEIVLDFDKHAPLSGDSLNMKYRDYRIKIDNLIAIARSISNGMSKRNMSADSIEVLRKELNSSFSKIYLEYNKNVLYDNLNNPLGEAALHSIASDIKPEDWGEIYSSLSPYLLSLDFTKMWNAKMQNALATDKGAMFIDIEGKTVDGKTSRLSDYLGKGKYVLVDFWASWCGPCRNEAETTLKPLYEKYGSDSRFDILGVAVLDNPVRSIDAIKANGYKWHQIIDVGMKPMEEYGFDGIPMIFLFAPDGTIVVRNIRGASIWKAVESVLQ